jgi:hypothetical protein
MARQDAAVAGETVFAWSWPRFLLAVTVVGVVAGALGWSAGTWLFSSLTGRPWPPPAGEAVASVLVYATAFPLFSLLLAGRLPSRLALLPDGIEMAAVRQDGVLIPYDAISRVRANWFWPVTVLEVSVDAAAEPQVSVLERGGGRPSRKRSGDDIKFLLPLAGLVVSARDITTRVDRLRNGASGDTHRPPPESNYSTE